MTPRPPERGRGRRNHWRDVWRRHPERMRDNLDLLRSINREKAEQRHTRLMAIVGMMPKGAKGSWVLRDELAEAWAEVFGEELTTRQAWNEVRFGIRRGVFVLRQDGLYDTMGPNGARPADGVEGLPGEEEQG